MSEGVSLASGLKGFPLTRLYTKLSFANRAIMGALGEVLARIVFKHKHQLHY